jgi:hypothetical protein
MTTTVTVCGAGTCNTTLVPGVYGPMTLPNGTSVNGAGAISAYLSGPSGSQFTALLSYSVTGSGAANFTIYGNNPNTVLVPKTWLLSRSNFAGQVTVSGTLNSNGSATFIYYPQLANPGTMTSTISGTLQFKVNP